MLAGLLQPTYAVKAATRGDKALEIVVEQAPALILLDIEMPDMSGYEVCRRLKASPQTQGIPVIFLTSKVDPESEEQGLAGTQIPVSARLMAVADVYDALISNRIYKGGMNHERAVQIITDGRGSHFDPDVVEAFLALGPEFNAIAKRFADTEQDIEQKAEYLAYML